MKLNWDQKWDRCPSVSSLSEVMILSQYFVYPSKSELMNASDKSIRKNCLKITTPKVYKAQILMNRTKVKSIKMVLTTIWEGSRLPRLWLFSKTNKANTTGKPMGIGICQKKPGKLSIRPNSNLSTQTFGTASRI